MVRLRALLERCEAAEGPDRELDQEAFGLLGDPPISDGMRDLYRAPTYTASIDAAHALVAKVFPNWWITAGLCSLTGHASIGPDYNGPAGERLKREFPVEKFDGGFDADLAPGDGRHRTCYAILSCILQALIVREEQRAGEEKEVAS
ncbi:hypothetical protein [Ancylobacter oerskovii]|uniref:Uncharacterized protein n=1 Tax=Ancylobacter oerskovii TaxID=459519 RepID=A0ABW4Z1B4_9HYPH